MASAPGQEFITLSSRRWRDADVAAGTDETAAQAAADRTLAAYTGSPGSSAPARRSGPVAGSSTKTGIVREVRSWYSAYGG